MQHGARPLRVTGVRVATIVVLVLITAAAVTMGAWVCLTYLDVWSAFAQAPVAAETPTERRLLLTTMVGSLGVIIVSFLSALFSAIDRSRVLRGERTKKGHELSTEAAFAMWKAATTAHRLLQRADDCAFAAEHATAISTAFEEAEHATLLLDDDSVRAFQRLWNESEAIGGRLLQCGTAIARAQDHFWRDEYEGFHALYRQLRATLRQDIAA